MRIAYLHKPEEMLVAHKLALNMMLAMNANPNPVNYHLFYEYALAENAPFNRFIDEMREKNELWSDILGVRLTERFFKEQERNIASCEQELMSAISEMSDNVSGHVDKHFELAQLLESNPEKAPIISAHLKKANRLLSHDVKDGQMRIQATRARLIEHKQTTMTDLLTRLRNEIHLKEFLPVIAKRSRSDEKRLVLAMIDIDNFTDYNSQHGHRLGDSLLRSYAKTLSSLGEGSYAWRLDGDGFLLAMVLNANAEVKSIIKGVHSQLASIHFKQSDDRDAVAQQSVTMVADVFTENLENTLNSLFNLMEKHRNRGSMIFSSNLNEDQ
jgi:diguanylate cyclase (GGDEF)-like protein